MSKYLPMAPFAAALVLVACQKADPVVDDAVAPSEAMLENSAEGLAAPANAAAAEAAGQAALPVTADGMHWTVRAEDRAADFGPAGAAPTFSIRCLASSQLAFVRHRSVQGSNGATMSFTGNGNASSLPASVAEGRWQAIAATGDMGRAVARTFDGPGQVIISVGGTAKLVVPPSPAATRLMAECVG